MRSEGYSSRSVCLCVCLLLFSDYRLRGGLCAIPTASVRSRDMAWKQAKKPIFIMSTGLPRPGLARSAHRGRIKFLRGYVSKSSAAANPLTITQLAWERYIARTSMRSALRGPAHQLAVRMRTRAPMAIIIISQSTSHAPCAEGLHFSAFHYICISNLKNYYILLVTLHQVLKY